MTAIAIGPHQAALCPPIDHSPPARCAIEHHQEAQREQIGLQEREVHLQASGPAKPWVANRRAASLRMRDRISQPSPGCWLARAMGELIDR